MMDLVTYFNHDFRPDATTMGDTAEYRSEWIGGIGIFDRDITPNRLSPTEDEILEYLDEQNDSEVMVGGTK